MSGLLERVRAKFGNAPEGEPTEPTEGAPRISEHARAGTDRTDKSPSGGFVSADPDTFGKFTGTPPDLRDVSPTSLRLGNLVLCESCQRFAPLPDIRPDGWCRHYSCETWARVPFSCALWRKRLRNIGGAGRADS